MQNDRTGEPQPARVGAAYDVVVIGFGPSGAVAAALLGQAGLSTLVCDRGRSVYPTPRAMAIDHEVLRVFDELGVLDDVLPHIEPFTDFLYYGAGGQLIKRSCEPPKPWPMAFPPSAAFSQPAIESVLRARVAQLPSVSVALGTTLVRTEPEADRVILALEQDDGAEIRVEARYVLGCDGAESTVRELSGLSLDDLGPDEHWLVIDALVNEQGLEKLPRNSVHYCEPARPCSFLIGPNGHRRWEFALQADDDPQLLTTPEGSWRLLRRWLGPDDATLWRRECYRFQAAVARDWRVGRTFVAGDAAHQLPPFFGQGMCQGIRDVKNLSWKLAAVLQGHASDALLDSYAVERKRYVERLVDRMKAIRALICERNSAAAHERDTRLLASGSVRAALRQDLQPPLEGGCLSSIAHAGRGTLLPQPWVVDPRNPRRRVRLDALTGAGWRLLLGSEARGLPELPRELIRRLDLTIMHASYGAPGSWMLELDGVMRRWMRSHRVLAALVRPDHYVFGVARTAVDLSNMLDSVSRFYA